MNLLQIRRNNLEIICNLENPTSDNLEARLLEHQDKTVMLALKLDGSEWAFGIHPRITSTSLDKENNRLEHEIKIVVMSGYERCNLHKCYIPANMPAIARCDHISQAIIAAIK